MPADQDEYRVGRTLRLDVERLAYGGDALGYAPDGRIVFFRGAAPKDTVTVRLTQVRKKYMRGQILDVVPGEIHEAPFCDVFGQCGGCPWQSVPAENQRAALDRHLRRRLKDLVPDQSCFSDMFVSDQKKWRSTTRLHIENDRIGFKSPRSHALVDIPECPILSAPLDQVLTAFRQHFRGAGMTGTVKLTASPESGSGTVFTELETCAPHEKKRLAEALIQEESIHGVVISCPAGRYALGDGVDRFGPTSVPHPAGSFVQAHQPGNTVLHQDVLNALADFHTVLELYAGSGNFTFALLAQGKQVRTVEIDEAAVQRLETEAKVRGLHPHLEVTCGDVSGASPMPCDALLLDPPRKGMPSLSAFVDKIQPSRIVYVSCNPETLARDLRNLVHHAWTIRTIRSYELFPHTGHLEVMAVVDRNPLKVRQV